MAVELGSSVGGASGTGLSLRLLPSAFHRDNPSSTVPAPQPLTTFVVKGAGAAGPLAIDAGSIGLVGEADDMAEIRGVLLTHAHIDHVATLPMWIEALLSKDRAPVAVHGSAATIDHLRTHLFNGVIFPDFERLTEADGRPLMEYQAIREDGPFELAGFTVEAFRTDHPVETHGYIVDDGRDAVAFGADSGPNEALWEAVARSPRVRAVVLEASFPDFMGEIAAGAGHLTPALLREECKRAPEGVRILVTHLKPAYRAGIARVIEGQGDPRVSVLEPGEEVILAGSASPRQ